MGGALHVSAEIGLPSNDSAYGMNLGRMLVRRKVNEWNREKVANGIIDTETVSTISRDRSMFMFQEIDLTVEWFRNEPIFRDQLAASLPFRQAKQDSDSPPDGQ